MTPHDPLGTKAAAYVHIWPGRLVIYRKNHPHNEIPLPTDQPDEQTLITAETLINQEGWVLGEEGWRNPLDPGVGLVATAHLYSVHRPRVGYGRKTVAEGNQPPHP